MKILTVSSARYGVKHVVYNLLDQLSVYDLEIDCLTLPIHEMPEGVNRITMLNEKRLRRLQSVQPLYLSYGIFFFWWKAYGYVRENWKEYDAIWLHNPRLLSRFPAEHSDKLVVTIHNHLQGEKTVHHSFPRSAYYRLMGEFEKRGINTVSGAKFTVVYDPVIDELRSVGVSEKDIKYIGNGVDVNRFSPGDEIDETSGLTFLYLGRLTHQKRPLGLIEMFQRLSEELDDATLLIAGTGPMKSQVKELVSEYTLDNVEFLGFVDEERKPNIYRSADIFILPSRYEGEPLTLYEALASGLPCIVSDLPNLQFVEEHDCGITIDVDDPTAAAKSVAAYARNEIRIESHRRNAREYAKSNLSWDSKAKEYHSLLQDLF